MNRILILLVSLALLGSSATAGGLSSSYTYLQGKGKVNYKEFKDAGRGIVLHDFNGDGYTDVGYGNGGHCVPGVECGERPTTGRVNIFLNDRKGRLNLNTRRAFTGKPYTFKLGELLPLRVPYRPEDNGKDTMADITGDGLADWIPFNSRTTTIPKRTSIIQMKRTRKLKVGPLKTPLMTFHQGQLADVDKDGDLDLVSALGTTHVFHNNGKGKFSCPEFNYEAVDWPPYKICWSPAVWWEEEPDGHDRHGWAFSVLVIDLDKDGLPEIIAAGPNDITSNLKDPNPSRSAKIYVLKNTGGKRWTFKKRQVLPGPGKWRSNSGRKFSVWAADSQAADFDGDGDLDGLFYHECGDWCSGTNPIVILKNLGNGKVKRVQIINASPAKGRYTGSSYNKACGAPQVVDLNGDKRPDLVFNYTSNYNGSMKNAHKQIWINKGNGTFKRLTTPIFRGLRKNSRRGKIVALHANKDKKIDWLIIWSDGTYGTLLAR